MIRKKIPCAVLTFSTTTAAMSMEKKCGDYKIPGRLIPVPERSPQAADLPGKRQQKIMKHISRK